MQYFRESRHQNDEQISDMDKIRHLFIVDIEFDKENSTEKQLFFNEICTTIFEKKGFVCKQKIHISNSRRTEAERQGHNKFLQNNCTNPRNNG